MICRSAFVSLGESKTKPETLISSLASVSMPFLAETPTKAPGSRMVGVTDGWMGGGDEEQLVTDRWMDGEDREELLVNGWTDEGDREQLVTDGWTVEGDGDGE